MAAALPVVEQGVTVFPGLAPAGTAAAPAPDRDPVGGRGAPRPWVPRRVLVTASAYERPHGARIVARCEAAGVRDIELLPGDRLPPVRGADERATYALAKSTL